MPGHSSRRVSEFSLTRDDAPRVIDSALREARAEEARLHESRSSSVAYWLDGISPFEPSFEEHAAEEQLKRASERVRNLEELQREHIKTIQHARPEPHIIDGEPLVFDDGDAGPRRGAAACTPCRASCVDLGGGSKPRTTSGFSDNSVCLRARANSP